MAGMGGASGLQYEPPWQRQQQQQQQMRLQQLMAQQQSVSLTHHSTKPTLYSQQNINQTTEMKVIFSEFDMRDGLGTSFNMEGDMIGYKSSLDYYFVTFLLCLRIYKKAPQLRPNLVSTNWLKNYVIAWYKLGIHVIRKSYLIYFVIKHDCIV